MLHHAQRPSMHTAGLLLVPIEAVANIGQMFVGWFISFSPLLCGRHIPKNNVGFVGNVDCLSGLINENNETNVYF